MQPGRHANSGEYRYGFTGLEKDDEILGSGNFYPFSGNSYDPRIARRWNLDPLFDEIPGLSPYAYSLNNPVVFKDPDGELPILPLLLKAGAAGAADMLAQAAMAYYFDPDVESVGGAFEKVNWWQVSRSSAEGLIPWKIPGGRIGRASATATGDVMINAIHAGSKYTKEQALQDFAVGFIGDLAGGGLGDLSAKYGSKAISKGLAKMGFDYGDINRMLGGGIKKIDKTFNNVTAKRKMTGWAEGKVAVIGRNMDRVRAFANGVGATVDNGGVFNPSDEAKKLAKEGNDKLLMKENKLWIEKLKDEGYTIFDVGLDPKYSNRGDYYSTPSSQDYSKGEYYKMETQEVFDDN